MGSKSIISHSHGSSDKGDIHPDYELQQSCKLFVGGLSYDTTDASLSRYFENYGQVASAVVMRDATTFRSRGFGFVTFCTLKAANEVVNYQKHVIDGRKVEAKFAIPRANTSKSTGSVVENEKAAQSSNSDGNSFSSRDMVDEAISGYPRGENESVTSSVRSNRTSRTQSMTRTESSNVSIMSKDGRYRTRSFSSLSSGERKNGGIVPNKVFVGGLLYATGHESLRDYFENFGDVETAEVIYNRDTKKSRGFGFVVFKKFDSVQKVLFEQERNKLIIDGKQVEVKYCMARQDSTIVIGKLAKDLELVQLGHRQKSNQCFSLSNNPCRPVASVEMKWEKEPDLGGYEDSIRNERFPGNEAFNLMPETQEYICVNVSKYEENDEPTGRFDIIKEPSCTNEFLGVDPLLDQSAGFPKLNTNTDFFSSGISSPLTSPLASPFTTSFAEDVASVGSFFTNPSIDDAWGTSERKYSIDDFVSENYRSKRNSLCDTSCLDASDGPLSPLEDLRGSPLSVDTNLGILAGTYDQEASGVKTFISGQFPSYTKVVSNKFFSMFSGTYDED